jgi:hypothetical protein
MTLASRPQRRVWASSFRIAASATVASKFTAAGAFLDHEHEDASARAKEGHVTLGSGMLVCLQL